MDKTSVFYQHRDGLISSFLQHRDGFYNTGMDFSEKDVSPARGGTGPAKRQRPCPGPINCLPWRAPRDPLSLRWVPLLTASVPPLSALKGLAGLQTQHWRPVSQRRDQHWRGGNPALVLESRALLQGFRACAFLRI